MLAVIQPAQAAWYEASSDHFVIYADQNEKDVREFAEKLERYRAAMEFLYGIKEEKLSPSNRVTVFVVRNVQKVRKLYGVSSGSSIAGFYSSRAGGSIAIVPRVEDGPGDRVSAGEQILLHEYAHHFMHSFYGGAFPLWFGEGFAEFYSTAKFTKEGAVGLGLPADHRGWEIFSAQDVPIQYLLDTRAYRERSKQNKRYDSFYGRSWLLYHYLTFSSERKGQFNAYLRYLREGRPEMTAAGLAFGDLGALDKEMDSYARARRMTYFELKPQAVQPGPIAVRRLNEAEAEMMAVVIESRAGVDEEEAAELVVDARAIASKYPDEPFVQAALAEAEYDAGFDDAAIAAGDRALARDPVNIKAHIQKMYALFRIAQKAKGDEADWSGVRAQIAAVNRIENDHPLPLIYFYRSYLEEGRQPTENAKQGLVQALALAPYDQGARFMLASQQMTDGQYDEARATLRPLAADVHNEGAVQAAETMLLAITAAEGTGDKAMTEGAAAAEAADGTAASE